MRKFINKLGEWFYFHSPIYVNLNIWKSIKYYIKCFNIFYAPVIVKYKMKYPEQGLSSDYFYLQLESPNKWLHISFEELGWKSKHGDYRFESCPYFTIVWMNKIRWVWGLEAPIYVEHISNGNIKYGGRDNDFYWETILYYLYKSKGDVVLTYKNNMWQRPIYDEKLSRTIFNIPITNLNIFRQKYKEKIISSLK